MLIGSICAAIAICLLGGFLCFRYVRQTFDEVDHMLDQAIQGHFDFATIAGETRQGKLCHKVKRLIQKLQADAEESAVEKSNVQGIISDISHQMKTPLASICMYTSLLLEENLTPKETQEFLLRTKNSANRLQWMMDTLFKMSRLETGAIALSPEYFSLRHTLLTSISAVQGGLSTKQMRIALHDFEDMELNGQPKQLATYWRMPSNTRLRKRPLILPSNRFPSMSALTSQTTAREFRPRNGMIFSKDSIVGRM